MPSRHSTGHWLCSLNFRVLLLVPDNAESSAYLIHFLLERKEVLDIKIFKLLEKECYKQDFSNRRATAVAATRASSKHVSTMLDVQIEEKKTKQKKNTDLCGCILFFIFLFEFHDPVISLTTDLSFQTHVNCLSHL